MKQQRLLFQGEKGKETTKKGEGSAERGCARHLNKVVSHWESRTKDVTLTMSQERARQTQDNVSQHLSKSRFLSTSRTSKHMFTQMFKCNRFIFHQIQFYCSYFQCSNIFYVFAPIFVFNSGSFYFGSSYIHFVTFDISMTSLPAILHRSPHSVFGSREEREGM